MVRSVNKQWELWIQNRAKKIGFITKPEQWCFIPAELYSPNLITPENLPSVVIADHFCFSESAFLQAPSVNWPINIPYENAKVDDLETGTYLLLR